MALQVWNRFQKPVWESCWDLIKCGELSSRTLRTVRDVASAAGVSVATVSRVLNKHPNVSRDTRERVLALIRESDFRPNAIARRLVNGRSGQICFLLSNRDIVHSFHSRVLKGVEDYCRQYLRQVVFTTMDYSPGDAMPCDSLPRIIREHHAIDGLLLAGTNYPNLWRYIERLGVPCVMFGNNLVTGSLALPRKGAVSYDEQGGAHDAAEVLIELGHRRIAFVGDLSQPWYLRCCEGYRTALKSRGLSPAVVNLEGEPDGERLGRRALPLLLRQHPKTTAVLAQGDETACGLLDGMNKLGIRVPEDISLVGYDDIAEIRYVRPALTTVRVPKEKIGWTMADLLFQTIRASGAALPAVVLGTELVIRDSCARLARGV
jgi:DNA-binding LacI/PurR family transcriptional regulator